MNEYYCWLSNEIQTSHQITADNALYAASIFGEHHVDWSTQDGPCYVAVKDDRGHIHKFEVTEGGNWPTVVHITE